MNKALITAVIGLSMLYAQSVSADMSNTQSASPKSHKAQKSQHHVGKHHHHVADASRHQPSDGSKARHHHKRHHHYKHERAHRHHSHHHHNHPQRGRCPERDCDEGMVDQRVYMRNQAVMDSGPGLEMQNDMSIVNRDHDPARGGRGRGD